MKFTGHLLVSSALLCALAAPAMAQAPSAMPSQTGSNFFTRFGAIVVSGDWLQANALPLDRDAMHSVAFDASLRQSFWAYDVGYLRIARDLSTIQGGTAAVGVQVHAGPVVFIPAIAALLGGAERSNDLSGFDFTRPDGTIGHTPRYTYLSGFTAGGGASLIAELPVAAGFAIRGSVQQWVFSGNSVEGDRARTVVGAGASYRLGGR